ncbi:MAG: AraC family transcriptional regulator [Ferruginibacter sp.]|nr:AraC family transcriptional regulator [Ferruginibacter sp.]
MSKQLKILLLEDSAPDAELIQFSLKKGGIQFTPMIVDTKKDFTSAIIHFKPDVILSDHSMPQFNAAEALDIFKDHLQQQQRFAPFILVTGAVSEEFAVQCIKNGALDYILKDNLSRLPAAISNALEKCRLDNEKMKGTAMQFRLLEEQMAQVMSSKEKEVFVASEKAKYLERLVVGKELHDSVNHLMGAAKLCIDMAKRGGVYSEIYLTRSSRYLSMAMHEISNLSKGLTSGAKLRLGLREAVENIILERMESSPVKISCEFENLDEKSVDNKFKINILRMVRDHIDYVLSDTDTSQITIKISQVKKLIQVLISDNGVSLPASKKQMAARLKSARSRATFYAGSADLIVQPGQGCLLSINLPVISASLKEVDDLDLRYDNKSMLIEKVKNVISAFIQLPENEMQTSFADYLVEKLKYRYSYLSAIFSKVEGSTIEKFVISQKIELVKELLINDGLHLTEIAYKLGYSSVSHLSNQFKKVTGSTPSAFKKLYH